MLSSRATYLCHDLSCFQQSSLFSLVVNVNYYVDNTINGLVNIYFLLWYISANIETKKGDKLLSSKSHRRNLSDTFMSKGYKMMTWYIVLQQINKNIIIFESRSILTGYDVIWNISRLFWNTQNGIIRY